MFQFHPTCLFVVIDGLWSNPRDVPRVAYDEEADGTFGTGALSGYGGGGDTHMLRRGRLSGDNHDYEDINWNGLSSLGPISMRGNTIHEDHCGDLTKGRREGEEGGGAVCVCGGGGRWGGREGGREGGRREGVVVVVRT